MVSLTFAIPTHHVACLLPMHSVGYILTEDGGIYAICIILKDLSANSGPLFWLL